MISQKSDTLPLKLQSPFPSTHFLAGSLFGPPDSPVTGFTSPSNSGCSGARASGCRAKSASASARLDAVCDRGACAFRTSSSNSRCASRGKGGGEGLFNECLGFEDMFRLLLAVLIELYRVSGVLMLELFIRRTWRLKKLANPDILLRRKSRIVLNAGSVRTNGVSMQQMDVLLADVSVVVETMCVQCARVATRLGKRS